VEAITQEIQDAIARNLPQAVGDALQKRLRQADSDAASIVELRSTIEANKSVIARLNDRVASLDSDLSAHKNLAEREAAVAERERNANVAELQIKLAAAASNAEFARSVAMGLVRNTEYRQSVFESHTNRAMPVPQGGAIMSTYNTETSNVSTERKAE